MFRQIILLSKQSAIALIDMIGLGLISLALEHLLKSSHLVFLSNVIFILQYKDFLMTNKVLLNYYYFSQKTFFFSLALLTHSIFSSLISCLFCYFSFTQDLVSLIGCWSFFYSLYLIKHLSELLFVINPPKIITHLLILSFSTPLFFLFLSFTKNSSITELKMLLSINFIFSSIVVLILKNLLSWGLEPFEKLNSL